MASLKRSKQREAILKYLEGTKCHPTADMVYDRIRQEQPNISLGTVYRNLSLLTDQGIIQKISIPGQPDRFDFRTDNHPHLTCAECGCVIDLDIDLPDLKTIADEAYDGEITGHQTFFFGLCPECLKKIRES